MPAAGRDRKSFGALAKRRGSHGGPTTVAVAVEPRKAVKPPASKRRRLSATVEKALPLRMRQQQQAVVTCAAASRGVGVGSSSSKRAASSKGTTQQQPHHLQAGKAAAGKSRRTTTTTTTTTTRTLESLPGDLQARICFSGYFDSLFVLNRLSMVNKHLRRLASESYLHMDLSRLPKLAQVDLRRVVERFTHLQTLDLSFCDGVDDKAVVELAPLRESLTSLSLRGCPISDEGVMALLSFHRMERLDLSKTKAEQTLTITDYSVRTVLAFMPRLQEISLAWNKCVTDDGVAALLADDRKQLRSLDLSCCVGLTDVTCGLLAGQPLEHLSLLGCPMITDKGIGTLLGLQPALSLLPPRSPVPSTQSAPPPPSAWLVAPSFSYASPSSTPRRPLPVPTLASLKLAHCPELTDATAEALLTLPALRTLDLRDCRAVSQEGRSKLQKKLPTAMVGLS